MFPLSELGPREKRTILVTELPRLYIEITEDVDENNTSSHNSKPNENKLKNMSSVSWELSDWIRNIFEEYGEVLYVSLPRYHHSNSFRGFAFVEFKTSKSARKAVKHMCLVVENEQWLVQPTETSEASDCPDAAWKPRLAAKVSFSLKQMLARRYIWRCCSRKNKQLITAFRHLRQAGYTASNPCDREYYSIILGNNSTEAILNYVKNNRNYELCQSKLRVFRYSDWLFWKQKFYLWQQAWIVRMHRKTELMLNNNNNISNDNIHSHEIASIIEENESYCMDSDMNQNLLPMKNCSDESSTKPKTLPNNFVPNSIVSGNSTNTPLSDNLCDTLITPKKLSFARLLRISLEKNLLVPHNLLNDILLINLDVVSYQLLMGMNSSPPLSSSSSVDFIPLFIRMKNNDAALRLLHSIDCSTTIHGVTARILEGSSEQAYCDNIVKSRVNARERHRTSQLKKRQKQKSSNPTPTSFNNFIPPSSSRSSNKTNNSKHIIFDE
ncbi:unnamed protein product [Schistosoma turkestanicum]|nr:unnamed protein product [Schistosoma turkestanicum]